MKFGNIADSIHRFSSAVRAGFLSYGSTYRRGDSSEESKIYLSIEPVDTMTQFVFVNMGDTTFIDKFRVFVAVLDGQEIDFVETPPINGDKIRVKIGAVAENWTVSKDGKSQCWGFLPGNQAIWIFARRDNG